MVHLPSKRSLAPLTCSTTHTHPAVHQPTLPAPVTSKADPTCRKRTHHFGNRPIASRVTLPSRKWTRHVENETRHHTDTKNAHSRCPHSPTHPFLATATHPACFRSHPVRFQPHMCIFSPAGMFSLVYREFGIGSNSPT
ncbi:hypothetical protein PAXRUDRAFT_307630 [Paxillus rubicundulus Ve08.2h10]|uniref:Uncharacterized protein n=1 Tax=Paxillus rubicundulus Ve08.2h10 TaxID=930991 RepID=A0A0D0DKT9_9AGAM|nr:hypothetical protein PAXRUDRAFT_307630 [Paxillus rubicundulus Ve08.2h10]